MKEDRQQTADRRPPTAIRHLLWWACISLIAIVLVEANAMLGLAVAIFGGIILGFRLFAQ